MSSISPALLDAIDTLVRELPAGAVAALADRLLAIEEDGWPARRHNMLGAVATPHYRRHTEMLLLAWQQDAADVPGAALALALMAASAVLGRARMSQTVEVVWTGPVGTLPVRRTAQVLQGLIDGAQRELMIVSFAVYDVPTIAAAIARAAQRGVTITIIIESPAASDGRVAYDGLAALGGAVTAIAQIYGWPHERRPHDATGRHGSLHAKCAIADRKTMLISSANLTHYALNLNMELGVRISGTPIPEQVAAHFQQLIDGDVLQLL